MLAIVTILFDDSVFNEPDHFMAQIQELAAIPGVQVELNFPFMGNAVVEPDAE